MILLLFNSHKETQKRVAGKTSAGGRQLVPSFLYKRPGFVFRSVAPGGEGWGMTIRRMGFQWSVWSPSEVDSRFFRTLGSLSSDPSCRPVRIRTLCLLGRINAWRSGSSKKRVNQKPEEIGRFLYLIHHNLRQLAVKKQSIRRRLRKVYFEKSDVQKPQANGRFK